MTKIYAKLKTIYSPDVELKSFTPSQRAFSVFTQLFFGPSIGEGEESVDVIVCSPEWLTSRMLSEGKLMIGHGLIIALEFDYAGFIDFVSAYGRSITGDSWDEVVDGLRLLGRYEFENYLDQP